MEYTPRQKAICENIVTIHETGKISNKSYSTVTDVRGDPGGLTYGKHQVTINSGGLYLMLSRYCALSQARYGADIKPWLQAVRSKTGPVVASPKFRELLVRAGSDPTMQFVQDSYFDDQYWKPAVKFCEANNLDLALSLAVVYDSTIHGSLYRVNKLVPKGLNTKSWTAAYVAARRNWLENHSIRLLRRCVYRMDTFKVLIEANNFELNPVVMAHGVIAEEPTAQPAVNIGIPPVYNTTQRILDRGDKGDDVVELQSMLLRVGYNIGSADGVFGRATEDAVKAFQTLYGLEVDGIVGPTTWRVLDQVDD